MDNVHEFELPSPADPEEVDALEQERLKALQDNIVMAFDSIGV